MMCFTIPFIEMFLDIFDNFIKKYSFLLKKSLITLLIKNSLENDKDMFLLLSC